MLLAFTLLGFVAEPPPPAVVDLKTTSCKLMGVAPDGVTPFAVDASGFTATCTTEPGIERCSVRLAKGQSQAGTGKSSFAIEFALIPDSKPSALAFAATGENNITLVFRAPSTTFVWAQTTRDPSGAVLQKICAGPMSFR